MIISDSVGSARTWRPLVTSVALLLIWDIGVTALYFWPAAHFDGLDIQFTIYGTAIALFVGVLINASYNRWWEARTLWGQIVNSSRSWGRQALVLVDGSARAESVEMVRAEIAFVHVLRTSLRRQPLPVEAEHLLSGRLLDDARTAPNPATAILLGIDRIVTEVRNQGHLTEFARIQMEATLVSLTDAQGGLERIKNTPLPVHFRFFPRFIARAFCVLLPFAVVNDLGLWTPIGSGLVGLMFLIAVQVGDDLADPFTDDIHDIPMTALCRTIQIDLTTMLGETPPSQVTPQNEILW